MTQTAQKFKISVPVDRFSPSQIMHDLNSSELLCDAQIGDWINDFSSDEVKRVTITVDVVMEYEEQE